MDNKSLKSLEYFKILELLEKKAKFSLSKEKVKNLKPITDINEIKKLQLETKEAVSYILQKGALPIGGISDISESIKRVTMNGTLSIEELLKIGDFLYVSKKVIRYSEKNGKDEYFDVIDPYFESLELVSKLEKEINRCIVNAKEISDNASTELLNIRKNIKGSNDKVKEKLTAIIHSTAYKDMLQDPIITIRNERYCVPVKQEYRNAFKGMVHDQSSTGATVFIEPMSVIEINNKIKELHLQEKTEIERILKQLSEMVDENKDILLSNLKILTELDFIFAKGELAIMQNATEPKFNENGYINLKKARHPLLGEDVVANDIYLGDGFSTLLITGPNTGGKTVTLKTIGLLTLMAQSGLHILAKDNSEVSIYENVYADIGDEQSIEQSLSTFSSHMTNIVRIINKVNHKSLVLFDELGAGTDPVEGAGLAIGIIKHLYSVGATVCVTTHYSELKVYALSTEGVQNASCEFDVKTLKPTYRLLIGVPGKSNAFAISQRLGLPDYIIDDAKTYITNQDEKFEDIITDLEISKKTVILEQEKAEQYRKEVEKLKADVEEQKDKLEKQKDRLLNEAKNEARKITKEAKEQADTLVKKMKDLYANKSTVKELDLTRQEIQSNLSKYTTGIENINKINDKNTNVPKKIKKGDEIFIISLNKVGVALSEIDRNGEVLVQAGIIKMKMHVTNLVLEKKKKNVQHKVAKATKKSMYATTEVDIRGENALDGVQIVDKFLDDAAMAKVNKVTIIHGRGTGVLRKAIQSHLKKHTLVKSYRYGVFGEGEDGVTIVELK